MPKKKPATLNETLPPTQNAGLREEEASEHEDWPTTPPTATASPASDTGLTYFTNTKANVVKIAGHPGMTCWVREHGDRNILCWKNPARSSQPKDIQTITIGSIRSRDLEAPNRYGAYTIDLDIDDETQSAFSELWKSGKWGATPEFRNPITPFRVAKFTARQSVLNKKAERGNSDLQLDDEDPFPGLHDGSRMSRDNPTLTPRPATDFKPGATVAVEATAATYDFTDRDGSRRFGYSLGVREIYWLADCDDENDERTPSKLKRKRSNNDIVSPGSYSRKRNKATFDPDTDDGEE
jgi:hypothetical protein